MRNHFQPGNALDFVAPAGGVVSGVTVKKGGLIHVPSTTAAEGEAYSGDLEGVFTLAAATSQAWTQGDVLYWDDTGKVWTKTATSNTKGGIAAYDKLAADAVGKVRLIPTI
ncbi:hypothetical protein BBAL3_2792 [Brevundimonas sp. BAL3]|uniref:DUF2190 family protein n=1 Tax=Brevundimonas sp. BAL3 TaxID=391600 RepID=UPI00017ED50D|nr:DUF2190 family protein [Brevundimonas sp. BAL3]EDX81635.1 hypothetical protein BBAL3_2792 [Brevundimonas sp. BAL3]